MIGFLKNIFSGIGVYITIGLALGLIIFLSGFMYFYTAKIEEAALAKQTIITLEQNVIDKNRFIESIKKIQKEQDDILQKNKQQIEIQNGQISDLERQLIMKYEASQQAPSILKEYFRGIK